MSEATTIAWADSTFNPWVGCTKVGPGCDGCYAEALMDRRMGRVKWGAGQPRRRTSGSYWRQPLAWNRKAAESGKPWRVFCGSLCDVLDNEVPEDWSNDLWELILTTPHLTWMLLTKRISNARRMLPWADDAECPVPANVWLGATVVTQEEADRDIPKLLEVPAAVRFLSIEPMLGPVSFRWAPWAGNYKPGWRERGEVQDHLDGLRKIDWLIVGGESNQPGHRARPFNIEWAREIVRQCKEAGTPVFIKQVGALVDCAECDATGHRIEPPGYAFAPTLICADRAGADPSEWPADLRVREWPR